MYSDESNYGEDMSQMTSSCRTCRPKIPPLKWVGKLGGWVCSKCRTFVANEQPLTCKCDDSKPTA